MAVSNAEFPRQLAPGISWLGNCDRVQVGSVAAHSYNSLYVVSGRASSLVIDTGLAKDWRVVDRQLDELLATGIAPVTHLFPTHVEVAHASNLGRLLEKFPAARVYGDVRDYHLIFPEFEDRLVGMGVGDEVDLGGRTLLFLKAIFKDMVTSLWAWDEEARVLFTGDGFSYTHYHGADECGKTAEELPELPIPEFTAAFADAAFYWTRFTDLEPIISEVGDLLTRFPVELIAPAHGAPIVDPPTTVPKVYEGLRLGQTADIHVVDSRTAPAFTATGGAADG
jgi:flavorubredoxin